MFDCLADQIRHDEHVMVTNRERMLRWFAVAVFTILAFGGVFLGLHVLE